GKSRLDVNTDTSLMFPETLPWRAEQIQFDADFPQFTDLIVAVVDGRIPEEADATAAALQAALKDDHQHFIKISRPDAVPYLRQEGLLLLDKPDLQSTLD